MDTILFDLDGTLLPLDMDEFILKYFKKLCNKFADIFEPGMLQEAIWSSTSYMISNIEKEKTNMDCFLKIFKKGRQKFRWIIPNFWWILSKGFCWFRAYCKSKSYSKGNYSNAKR